MELFRIKRDLPLMKHALIFNVISFLTFAAAVFPVTRGCISPSSSPAAPSSRWPTRRRPRSSARATPSSRWGFGEVQVQNFGPA